MAQAQLKPIYVLCGSDTFRLDEERRQIVSDVIGKSDPQTCVADFDGAEVLEPAAVIDELRTVPFLSPGRVVIIRNADAFVTKYRKSLEKYLENPCRTSALLLMVTTFRSNTLLSKTARRIGEVIDCNVRETKDLRKWLTDAAARRGKKIAPPARQLLSRWVGKDLGALDREIEKLCLYVGQRNTITTEDIAAVGSDTAGPVDYALTNALSAGGAPQALRELNRLLRRRGDEFRALGSIAWHLRRALEAQQAIAAGNRLPSLRRMPFRAREAFVGMLKRRGAKTLQGDMRRLLSADLGMKSGADPKATLQELVMALCS